MDLTSSLSELRAAVEQARALPMSSSAVINRTEVLRLLDRVEQALPEAFADSARVVSRRDAVVADAQSRGDRIVDEARNERDRLVSDTEVYRNARRDAAALRAQAQQESDELRRETDEYVDTCLARLQNTLTKTLEAVSRGRGRLNDRRELDSGPLEPAASPAGAQPSESRVHRPAAPPTGGASRPDRSLDQGGSDRHLPDQPRAASPLPQR